MLLLAWGGAADAGPAKGRIARAGAATRAKLAQLRKPKKPNAERTGLGKTHYLVERTIAQPAGTVWDAIADVRHYVTEDPYHTDFAWDGALREGKGTQFQLTHNYRPIFPFGKDRVRATITRWEPGRRQMLAEKNLRHSFKNHTQQFRLEPAGDATRVSFDIYYRGVPKLLNLWVRPMVQRRMWDKLHQIEADAERLSRGEPTSVRRAFGDD